MRWLWLGMLSLTVMGCKNPDPDGDGLTTEEEMALGTDPNLADTDGDGLSDADDIAFGTDPLIADTDGDGLTDGEESDAGSSGTVVDTDGDGYTDLEEVLAGSNPSDETDRVYVGGWPFNVDKDALAEPGWDGPPTIGGLFPRLQGMDQHGDVVDLYDFAHQGRPVVIDLSGIWCYWCHELAELLDGDGSALALAGYGPVHNLILRDEVYWITVIDADDDYLPATHEDVLAWAAVHDNPKIPVLLDDSYQLYGYLAPESYPALVLLNEDLTLAVHGNTYFDVLDVLLLIESQ